MDGTCLTGYKFERGHPVVYYQICIIYYAPSIHNIPVTAETCSQSHLIVIIASCLMYAVY